MSNALNNLVVSWTCICIGIIRITLVIWLLWCSIYQWRYSHLSDFIKHYLVDTISFNDTIMNLSGSSFPYLSVLVDFYPFNLKLWLIYLIGCDTFLPYKKWIHYTLLLKLPRGHIWAYEFASSTDFSCTRLSKFSQIIFSTANFRYVESWGFFFIFLFSLLLYFFLNYYNWFVRANSRLQLFPLLLKLRCNCKFFITFCHR